MILYALRCENGHEFEAWFRDAATYDRQAAAGAVVCPMCDSRRVGKAIMAPRLARHHGARDAGAPVPAAPDSTSAPPGGAAAGIGSDAAPAPAPAPTPEAEPAPGGAARPALVEALRALRDVVEQSCEDVGDRFAEEARRIHYGETDPRGIRGQATADEAESRREEGISFSTLPWIRRPDA
jgi:hypothetical protein